MARALRALARGWAFLATGALWLAVFAPWGMLRRLLGADPLDLRLRTGKSYWRERAPRAREDYERLF